MKNIKVLLIAVLSMFSVAAMAGDYESDIDVDHPFTSGSGDGSGSWSEHPLTLVITLEGEEETTMGIWSHVETESTVVLTPDGNGGHTGTSTVTACTNLGGLLNGCNQITIDDTITLDSVSAITDNGDGTSEVETELTVAAFGGDAVTTVTITLDGY